MEHPASHVESHWRTQLRNRIIQASSLLEILLSGLVLIGLLFSAVPLIRWMPGLLIDGNEVEIRTFLERSLDIVIGIEFIKMLAKHSPGSSLEVLLYAIARHLVVGHLKPLYFGFKGGKGVLVAGGAILAIQPVLLPFLALIFLACLLPTGMVSLGSVTMAAAYPLLTLGYCLLRGYAVQDLLICLVGSVIMAAMVIYMHRSNIQRIRDGKEYRFGRHGKQ